MDGRTGRNKDSKNANIAKSYEVYEVMENYDRPHPERTREEDEYL